MAAVAAVDAMEAMQAMQAMEAVPFTDPNGVDEPSIVGKVGQGTCVD